MMLISKSVLLGVVALLGSASSQVVVTVTNTVTVITVTVTPLSTSTATVWTTIQGQAPTSTLSTSTKTLTVTVGASSTSTDSCPIPLYGQCGGINLSSSCGACEAGSHCKYVNAYYSQCQPRSAKVETVVVPVYQAIEA